MTSMGGKPPAEAFATLHLGFGLLLVAALMVYLLSRDRRAEG
jgi:hypothetical protein